MMRLLHNILRSWMLMLNTFCLLFFYTMELETLKLKRIQAVEHVSQKNRKRKYVKMIECGIKSSRGVNTMQDRIPHVTV